MKFQKGAFVAKNEHFDPFLASFIFFVKLQYSNNISENYYHEKPSKQHFSKLTIFVYRAVVENTAR